MQNRIVLMVRAEMVTIYLQFSDPPGAPNITGITAETVLIEDQVRRMTCISMAGNPLADLKWFAADAELTSAVTVKGEDGDYSKSDLTITVNR